jgi:hypothetical protein
MEKHVDYVVVKRDVEAILRHMPVSTNVIESVVAYVILERDKAREDGYASGYEAGTTTYNSDDYYSGYEEGYASGCLTKERGLCN